MTDRSSKPFDVSATAATPVAGLRLAPQMLMMFLLGVALVVVIAIVTYSILFFGL